VSAELIHCWNRKVLFIRSSQYVHDKNHSKI